MATYHFLELNKHYPDFKLFQPFISFELNNLDMEATTLDYTEEGNLLFVGLSKKSNSILNKVIFLLNTI